MDASNTHLATIPDRLAAVRQKMKEASLDAWIALSSDPHLSEYVPEHFSQREWLSGFTGSAGVLVILAEDAALWADSRYWVQAEKQLQGTGIHLEKMTHDRLYYDWLAEVLPSGARVGIDGAVVSVSAAAQIEEALAPGDITLVTDIDVVDDIWQDRAPLPKEPIYAHPEPYAGTPRTERIAQLREVLKKRDAEWQLLSSLDDIAWLFTLRGSDVDYNPVFLAHALIGQDQALLFVDLDKIPSALQTELKDEGITLVAYEEILDTLKTLPEDATISLDPQKVSLKFYEALPEGAELITGISPTTLAKGCKSDADLAHVRHAMEKDGAALCEFFEDFERALAAGEPVSELTVDERLTARRAAKENYVSLSFPTIAGFNENGALPHYRALPNDYSEIKGDGLLLIDSGTQYLDGTTDITRVIAIGTPSEQQKRDYTTVLKAMIALSRASFPEGIKAPSIDAIARAPLWAQGFDFGHGTGHGVGYFMNVHEGPQSIAYPTPPTPERAMRKGMITSIEPGLYRAERWGIRIENLVANRELTTADGEFGEFLTFETLTLCPIDTRPIIRALLTQEEVDWLNAYHAEVRARLTPHLDEKVGQWLEEKTRPID